MPRMSRALPAVVIAALAACSSSSGGGEPRQCLAAPAQIDTSQPAVSYSASVVPILQRNCALPACHADPNTTLGIFLPTDGARAYESLKKPAVTNLKLDFVKPNAPNESFLMHKVDGTQCSLDADCVKSDCGDVMPPDRQLSVADRDLIRRWIAQGAKND